MPIYMKYEGIDGDAVAEGYHKWIEIESCSFSAANASGGGGKGKVSVSDLSFSHVARSSSATPQLLDATCKGKVFPKVEIHFVSSGAEGQANYLKYELKNVLVSNFQQGGHSDGPPVDQLGLTFEAAAMSIQNADGAVGAGATCEGR